MFLFDFSEYWKTFVYWTAFESKGKRKITFLKYIKEVISDLYREVWCSFKAKFTRKCDHKEKEEKIN